ncbi:unnamed protein product, partial [Didymodactylos carnosus]
ISSGVDSKVELEYANPIKWYTNNETFIYRQINNILRLENFQLLMSYRYYIIDLCLQIETLYRHDKSHVTMIYRAGNISEIELMNVKCGSKAGQYIAMNGFVSTTKSKRFAESWTKCNKSKRPGVVSVIYEIRIDSNQPCTAFADIGNISQHPEEQEVLFSIGAVFSVDQVIDPLVDDTDKFYYIKLTACDLNEIIIDDIRSKVKRSSQTALRILLSKYLTELGEYRFV